MEAFNPSGGSQWQVQQLLHSLVPEPVNNLKQYRYIQGEWEMADLPCSIQTTTSK